MGIKRFQTLALAALPLLALSGLAQARIHRSHGALAAFKLEHPCPATQAPRGPCPGYVIDHIVPLCAGGPDKPGNMQWQTVVDAKVKDREEVRQCRALRAVNPYTGKEGTK